jgi:hypothetical protein
MWLELEQSASKRLKAAQTPSDASHSAAELIRPRIVPNPFQRYRTVAWLHCGEIGRQPLHSE